MQLLARLQQLSPTRRRLLVVAGFALLRTSLQVRYQPFARIAAELGRAHAVSPASPEPAPEQLSLDQRRRAQDIAWALAQWAQRWRRPPTCLMLALAGRRLLDQAGLPSRLYFGVRSSQSTAADAPSRIGAHAWLCSADMVITGAGEAATHQPIALYRSKDGMPTEALQ